MVAGATAKIQTEQRSWNPKA